MRLGKRQRKILWSLGAISGGLLLLLLAVPLWLPWCLPRIAARFGAAYKSSERHGYDHLVLHELSLTNHDITLRVEKVDALVPTVWLWRRALNQADDPFLSVQSWNLEIRPTGKPGHGLARSTYTEITNIEAIVRKVQSWIPNATVSGGSIRTPAVMIDLPTATLSRGHVEVTCSSPQVSLFERFPGLQLSPVSESKAAQSTNRLLKFELTVQRNTTNGYTARVQSDALRLAAKLSLAHDELGSHLQSEGAWSSNQFRLEALFAPTGSLPASVTVEATNVHVAGSAAGLGQLERVDGSLKGSWNNSRFRVDLSAHAVPLAQQTNWPPLDAELHASGDFQKATVHAVSLVAPWLTARLSREATVNFSGQLLREPALLSVSLDLRQQHWAELHGLLVGEVLLSPRKGKFPEAHFEFAGGDIGTSELSAARVATRGHLAWPSLHLEEANIGFADGSVANVQGDLDIDGKVISGGHLYVTGALGCHWLPDGYRYQTLRIAAALDGPLKQLRHSGHVEISGVEIPHLQPLNVRADWLGEQMNIERAALLLSAGGSSIVAEGATQADGSTNQLFLERLSLVRTGEVALAIALPTSVVLEGGPDSARQLRIHSFDWRGKSGQVGLEARLDWPRSCAVNASVRDLTTTVTDDFTKKSLPEVHIQRFDLDGGWTNGPAAFLVRANASTRVAVPVAPIAANTAGAVSSATTTQNLAVAVGLDLRGDANGIGISNLTVSSQTSPVLVARGFLPATFNLAAGTNLFTIKQQSAFQLTASSEPQSQFWDQVGVWTGLSFHDPALQLQVSGTWEAPRGQLHFQTPQVKFRDGKAKLPAVDDVTIAIELDRRMARVEQCDFRVQNQPVQLTGQIPLPDVTSSGGLKALDWKQVQAHLRIQRAELAAFTPMLPEVLSPQGEMDLDVGLQPGGKFDGQLSISRARTRPLPSLGPIRDIDLQMSFHEQLLTIESASARIGGAPVIAQGEAQLQNLDFLRNGSIPPFKIALRGTNVPLSRQPESILRSDLELTLTKTNDQPALLAGTARLRDSFYLHDLADLVPGRVASPSRRPPYFSIETEPLADWRLAVQVTGQKFLNVRSTLFNGAVSANLKLQGTLKEPLALGEVRVDSGTVRFPFASLNVQQGFVTLNSQEPYRPQLLVSAGAKQYGFDIKMDLSGPADAPVVQFVSTPPLSSEQIVLMVTAGELPREERALSTQQRAQTFAVFLGRDLWARLGFGDEGQQRLTIRSGEELSEQGKPTYNVEYELTPRWSLVGEYDRFNAYNAGLKWRIYSK